MLSVGSNLGDRLRCLQLAVDAVRPWLRAVSPVFETPPWGPVPQADYLNAVLLVDDPGAGPADWLARAHAAERAAGRTRDVRWGPRTLDVDVVAVRVASDRSASGRLASDRVASVEVVSDDPELTLPHPRAAERAFVLVPWLAADPAAELRGRPVAELLAELPAADVAGVRPADSAALR
ncbi:2-amino-4-hydroxy-6-hydroxymethyldihydropteridine diphosphokinase [uncultured Jatrophihabitans sp.]|uniref:2-amino-4-hydroxy-6- hydroxymethyldihydropteridine diphosphokinase n=1 Tax=uncultured Jatrophihabitans sp. TaxID=1610747 RepID=UPI0035C944AC